MIVKNSRHPNETVRSGPAAVRAVAAFSGGLDSILAAVLVRHLGFDVLLLHVQHLFSANEEGRRRLRAAADHVGLPLKIVDASEAHLETVRHPKHGYGAGMNPCVDCRVFMLAITRRAMEEEGAAFVVTGEVLGQRPKSQHYGALLAAAEESSLGDRLLRPLSANLLPDTLPVKMGWIRRDDLLSIHGRSRETQMALAESFGISDFPQPAGGCVLIEKPYAARVRDAFAHYGKEAVGVEQFLLFRHGRHFRLSDTAKIIVGRFREENDVLAGFASGRVRIDPVDVMGPTTLVDGDPSEEDLLLAASIAARYSDAAGRMTIPMRVKWADHERVVEAAPLAADDLRLAAWRVGG